MGVYRIKKLEKRIKKLKSRKEKLLILFSNFLILFSNPLPAENYTITASPLFSEKNSGSETESLTAKDMESTQNNFAPAQLERLPALNVSAYGPSGRTVEYTLRGAKSSQNAVFLDGIPLNNPAAGGKFDFADILVEDLEEIEVLPGANSVIYGADALGGVINLKTKRGHGKPRAIAKGGLGNRNTQQGHAEAQGELHNFNFYAGGTGYQSGNGTFQNKVHHNMQSDRYRNGTLTASFGMTPNDNADIWGFVRQVDSHLKLDDDQKGLPVASPFSSHTRLTVGGIQGDLNTFEDLWEHHIVLGLSRTRRDAESATTPTFSDGKDTRLKYYQDVHLTRWSTTTLGTDLGHESAEDGYTGYHNRNHQAFFAQEKFKPLAGLELTSGARYDHYSSGGTRVTYRLGAAQTMGNSRVRSSVGTGFKPPVLSDMFNNSAFTIPNLNLKPETNTSFDVGFDHKIREKFEFHLTGFLNQIDHVIVNQQVAGMKYQRVNAGQRRVRGIESAIGGKPFEQLALKSTLTLTRAKDQNTGKRAPNIPFVKGTFEAFWSPLKSVTFFTTLDYKGTQTDAVTSQKLKPYMTLNVGGQYHLHKHVSLFGRVENLNNKRYEDVFGYGVRGQLFMVGLEVRS